MKNSLINHIIYHARIFRSTRGRLSTIMQRIIQPPKIKKVNSGKKKCSTRLEEMSSSCFQPALPFHSLKGPGTIIRFSVDFLAHAGRSPHPDKGQNILLSPNGSTHLRRPSAEPRIRSLNVGFDKSHLKCGPLNFTCSKFSASPSRS